MAKNEIVPQYYNLFDATKGYTELLFRAGKVLQSKELNELQSILKNQIKNVGNTILTNGDIIEGCQLVISDDHTQVTMTKGRIYLDGDVREVPDTTMAIAGTGVEVIGAILQTAVITSDEDSSLVDVATGYDNYNQDGAYRMKETVKITLNNPNAAILYNLVDGEQLVVNKTEDLTQLDKMNATLARRTFEESGNYKVSGLTLSDKQQSDTDYIYITLEAGKAYVRGYEVNKDVASTIRLERAADLRSIENESKQFRTGVNEYVLNNNYVNSIKKVMAEVGVTDNITRGSVVGGIDYLPLSPVASIVSIVQGSEAYIEGTDFQLLNDGVDWSIGSRAPNPNTTYTVTWTYNKTLLKNTDYTLVHSDTWYNGFVKFIDTGDKPIDSTRFYVNYDFLLCRRDVIGIDQYGNILVTKGQSDILRTVESPIVGNENQLVLGSVLLKPKSDEVGIINNNTKTVRMLEIYNMLERINDLEYNQAVTDLDQEAADGENATQLRGILTDGFLGFTKSDVTHALWSGCIDSEAQELTIPSSPEAIVSLVPNTSSSYYKARVVGPYILNNFTEIQLLTQPLASESFRVNAYDAFPKMPVLTLDPFDDSWIDTEGIVIKDKGTIVVSSTSLRRWWYHKGESWAAAEKQKWIDLGFADGGESLNWADGVSDSGDKSFNLVNTLREAITYMRRSTIKVDIQNLEPNVDKIIATFNGSPVSLTSTESKYQGSQTGSLKADATGTAKGQFIVPANVQCGTVEVAVYPANYPSLVGMAKFTSNGIKETNQFESFTARTVVNAVDPLAQSFQFDQDQVITGVGLYFLDKDPTESLTIQVRNMVNGYPGTLEYASVTVSGASVRNSTTADSETKIQFDKPVHCRAGEQYCFVVISNSTIDSLWIAETAHTDINSNALISKNPYINGMMFSSSNALTWTAHQSQDLKFNLYGAQFATSGQVLFNPITGVEFDRILLQSTESLPIGCLTQWEASINGGDWLPIKSGVDKELDEVAETIQLRCVFQGNTTTSPIMILSSLTLGGYLTQSRGVYVSRNVDVPNGFNHVKAMMDMYLPSGSNAMVTFATDINGNVWTPLTNIETVQKSSTYKTYTFEADLVESASSYRVKIELTAINPINRPRVQKLKNILKTI